MANFFVTPTWFLRITTIEAQDSTDNVPTELHTRILYQPKLFEMVRYMFLVK